jgi:stage II sporulation protein D
MLEFLEDQPSVKVGLMTGLERVNFTLLADCSADHGDGRAFSADDYAATLGPHGELLILDRHGRAEPGAGQLSLLPLSEDAGFMLRGVTIGIDFHWQRQEDQQFTGKLLLRTDEGKLTVINEVGVEDYLTSVIASEMSATAHPELLKAHAIISRSWLLAQLAPWKPRRAVQPAQPSHGGELIRWYDREDHTTFDICADDHCQRYQGIAKATSPAVFAAIAATRGLVLSHANELCDARFSKSCGGFTELFSTAWEDADPPYLQAFYDGEVFPAGSALPLTDEAHAAAWIRHTPPAFCATREGAVLARILPGFDQETTDFYRWQVTIEQTELQALLQQKLKMDFGAVLKLEPLERGASGRLKRLRIVGEKQTLIIGKELEIRRALSPSHLYSSAFVVEPGPVQNGAPTAFSLHGAGWGHGVGLCQIGAALMAERGYDYAQILQHYYRGTQLFRLYR